MPCSTRLSSASKRINEHLFEYYFAISPINRTQDFIRRFTMKDKLISTLGVFGGIIWFLVSALISFLPLAMIGGSFWLNLLFFAILFFIPSTSAIFWVWGLVCAIQGQQDAWAIVYYVLFVVAFLPYFVSTILGLIRAIFNK